MITLPKTFRHSLPILILGLTLVHETPTGAEEPAAKKPDRSKILKTFASEFVEITPGKGDFPASFEMGSNRGKPSEKPVHKVTIPYSFEIAKYEVTQELYEAVAGNNPSKWKGPRNSAEMMMWTEAVDFCRTVTKLLRKEKLIAQDEEIRLPTEAEWEYCCRAGTETAYSFGDDAVKKGDKEKQATILNAYGWHTGNAKGKDPPVGALKPNPWGLYDVHGYLSEFTADAWFDNYEDAPTDGGVRKAKQDATDDEPKRVVRGGSWKDRYEALRSSARSPIAADARDDAVGFRCVKAKVKRTQ